MEELLRQAFQLGQQWSHDINFTENEPVNFNEWFNSPEVQEMKNQIIKKHMTNLVTDADFITFTKDCGINGWNELETFLDKYVQYNS